MKQQMWPGKQPGHRLEPRVRLPQSVQKHSSFKFVVARSRVSTRYSALVSAVANQ